MKARNGKTTRVPDILKHLHPAVSQRPDSTEIEDHNWQSEVRDLWERS